MSWHRAATIISSLAPSASSTKATAGAAAPGGRFKEAVTAALYIALRFATHRKRALLLSLIGVVFGRLRQFLLRLAERTCELGQLTPAKEHQDQHQRDQELGCSDRRDAHAESVRTS